MILEILCRFTEDTEKSKFTENIRRADAKNADFLGKKLSRYEFRRMNFLPKKVPRNFSITENSRH